VQGLLLRPGDTTVSLTEIVQAELAAVGATPAAERVVIAGPPVTLSHEIMQLLALALHELATNALKYGALKSDNGHVDVTWQVLNPAGTSHLELTWAESGVELDGHTAGSLRIGYGRKLLEQGIPYEFGATTQFELLKDGIRWSLNMPLPSVDQGGV
jgi:two-component sensor histidine kinase